MQTFYKKVVLDCFDAQQADGHVPSVAPYYMNVYGDDVNWGGAAILTPYRLWKYYGDKSLMTKYYAQMKLLLDVTQRTPCGQVRVAWQRTSGGYRFQFSVPAGAQATVILPAIEGKRLMENGTDMAAGTRGVVSVTYGQAETRLVIGSGYYDLTL